MYVYDRWINHGHDLMLEKVNRVLSQTGLRTVAFSDYDTEKRYDAVWLLDDGHCSLTVFKDENRSYLEMTTDNYLRHAHYMGHVIQSFREELVPRKLEVTF